MDGDGEAEIGRESAGDRPPALAVVIAAKDADIRAFPSRPVPLGPPAVVLHIESAWGLWGRDDLMHALAELGIELRNESGADPLIGGSKRPAAVFAQVMPAGGDSEVDAVAVADDGVHAESAVARLPFCAWGWSLIPGTISHESPASPLRNRAAGSTPHQSSFLPAPASSAQMFASARPSSGANAGAAFVSLNDLPRLFERRIFMPKNGLQLDASSRGVPRVSINVE